MINRKSRDEIKRMRHAGHIVALVHKKMKEVEIYIHRNTANLKNPKVAQDLKQQIIKWS